MPLAADRAMVRMPMGSLAVMRAQDSMTKAVSARQRAMREGHQTALTQAFSVGEPVSMRAACAAWDGGGEGEEWQGAVGAE